MSDDHVEFMETAVNFPSEPPKGRKTDTNELRFKLFHDKDEDDVPPKPGAPTQYAQVGDGYIPTTPTIAALPPDCYSIAYLPNGAPYLKPQHLVTDELLRLPDSKSDEVIAEVTRFWTLKDRFEKLGFAHKRGFLLWGPPGSGKTSTVQIIIKDMIVAGGVVILAENPNALSNILSGFRQVEKDRPLVVIWEDIDTVIQNYGEAEVLSVLDGENQVENVVYIATTNYPENLDGRIVNRPSRFDKIVKIGLPNDEARKTYLMSKLGATEHEGVDLVKETDGLSIAHIKELIIGVFCQDNDAKEVIKRLQTMKQKPKSSFEGSIGFGKM